MMDAHGIIWYLIWNMRINRSIIAAPFLGLLATAYLLEGAPDEDRKSTRLNSSHRH